MEFVVYDKFLGTTPSKLLNSELQRLCRVVSEMAIHGRPKRIL